MNLPTSSQKLSLLILGDHVDESFIDPNIFPPHAAISSLLQSNPNFHVDLMEPKRDSYDAVIVFNTPKTKVEVNVVCGNVFALMQEPGESQYNRFMFKNLDQYDTVFSPIIQSSNTFQSIPFLSWHLHKTHDELCSMLPSKSKLMSCIVSSKNTLKGHKLRLRFINKLKQTKINIDYFGKGTETFIKDKSDGLLNYKYSIAIENSSKDYYFTEKIIDCFLCYTIPFYYGCTNIKKFFPEKSYIWIDINNPDRSINTIIETLSNEDYADRIPYLEEARELVLTKYTTTGFIQQLTPRIIKNKYHTEAVIKKYVLSPVVNKKKLSGLRRFYRVCRKIVIDRFGLGL